MRAAQGAAVQYPRLHIPSRQRAALCFARGLMGSAPARLREGVVLGYHLLCRVFRGHLIGHSPYCFGVEYVHGNRVDHCGSIAQPTPSWRDVVVATSSLRVLVVELRPNAINAPIHGGV